MNATVCGSRPTRILLALAMLATIAHGTANAQTPPKAEIDWSGVADRVAVGAPASAAAGQAAQAGEESPTLRFFNNVELAGFVDMYYTYNVNRPADGLNKLYNFKFQANDVFALIPRFEWFDDTDGWATIGQTVTEFTLTAEVKSAAGLLMRAEYRGDFSDDPFFAKRSATDLVKTQNTLTVGFVYAFSSKAP